MNSTSRFTDRVEDYVRYRPHYPSQEILNYLQDRIAFNPSWVVADIGSGTGISTELFLKNGNKVYGVEPNEAMRQKAEQLLKGYPAFISVNGTAEQTQLATESADLVVAGQAFHWFNPPQAKTEFGRITKTNGYIVLIWNIREVNTPFEKDYEVLLQEFGTDYKEVGHKDIATDEKLTAFFAPAALEKATFANNQVLDYEGVKGRLLSSSYIPAPGAPNYQPMLDVLEKIFNKHAADEKVVFGYTTKVYMGKAK
ncbi:Methyltransferase domain-containing protein [Chitinophaga sp. CF118]|uniref:class I SAM-dependent methyltransferase n=1 Tax=Chitinophaga sp. CF118 TaxID=1884367 RepID=UPI0008F1A9F3|nr:class I SAM-dependent methyltransferase [Chitinophaga sp. CF118]SFD56569.1 Methyltransferase domain-containing protein [Chitinophaga sp. CF118]